MRVTSHLIISRWYLPARRAGFTLIEMLVVLAILGVLVGLVAPRYMHQVDRAREAVVHQQLIAMRDAIDRFYGLHQRYPESLQELVEKRFIREIPIDPLTERADSWLLEQDARRGKGIYNVHSGAPGEGSDGRAYAQW
jgi:general secretion pathway protein G